MPNSLRCMINKLHFKRKITDAEYEELITKLDNHDKVVFDAQMEKVRAEIKQAVIDANKEIDTYEQEYEDSDYPRGWLGGQFEIIDIFKRHFGKIIDEEEIMAEYKGEESEEEE